MTPLRYVVVGFVLVFADIRLGGVDVLPDPAGWAFILLGLQQLLPRHPALVVPRNAAVVGLVVSIPLVVVRLGAFADLAVATVLQVMIFFTVCTALLRIVVRPDARMVYDRARWLELAVALTGLVALGLGAASAAALLLLVDIGVVAWAMYWTWTISGSDTDSEELLPR